MTITHYVGSPTYDHSVNPADIEPQLAALPEPRAAFCDRYADVIVIQWTVSTSLPSGGTTTCELLAEYDLDDDEWAVTAPEWAVEDEVQAKVPVDAKSWVDVDVQKVCEVVCTALDVDDEQDTVRLYD